MQLVVQDYAQRIRGKRESMGLTQEKFAQQLNEKESVIHHLEVGKGGMSLDLARKLERKLGITLVEQYEDSTEKIKKTDNVALTIGDLIKAKE
jgi:putative transcription factor